MVRSTFVIGEQFCNEVEAERAAERTRGVGGGDVRWIRSAKVEARGILVPLKYYRFAALITRHQTCSSTCMLPPCCACSKAAILASIRCRDEFRKGNFYVEFGRPLLENHSHATCLLPTVAPARKQIQNSFQNVFNLRTIERSNDRPFRICPDSDVIDTDTKSPLNQRGA